MLVPYEPYFAFDVHRTEKCCPSCGKEEAFTIESGKNKGYCKSCLDAKLRFISAIVGSIKVNQELDNMIVSMVEATRVKMMGDRISYMIDTYFVTNPQGNPYNDLDFVIRCYHDKADCLSEFSNELNRIIEQEMSGKRRLSISRLTVETAYVRYYHAIGMMNVQDWNTINELCQQREANRAENEKKRELKLKNNDEF